jgi:hypothetical protein
MFVEIIRRDDQKTIAGTFLRKIARMRHQPIAFMNENNDGIAPSRRRSREKSRHLAGADDFFGFDLAIRAAHCLLAY